MGIFSIFTKQIHLGGTKLSWNEPFAYPIQLRGDMLLRLFISVAVGLAVTGIVLVMMSRQQQPEPWVYALVFGIFGSFLALLIIFGLFKERYRFGKVVLNSNSICRTSTTGGFNLLTVCKEYWEYHLILDCKFILNEDLGQRFSVMLFTYNGQEYMIAIPGRKKAKKVASILHKQGVSVKRSKRLPEEYTERKLSFLLPSTISVVSLITVLVGMMMYSAALNAPSREESMADESPTTEQQHDFPSVSTSFPTPVKVESHAPSDSSSIRDTHSLPHDSFPGMDTTNNRQSPSPRFQHFGPGSSPQDMRPSRATRSSREPYRSPDTFRSHREFPAPPGFREQSGFPGTVDRGIEDNSELK